MHLDSPPFCDYYVKYVNFSKIIDIIMHRSRTRTFPFMRAVRILIHPVLLREFK